jgi:hypothetical protein
MPKWQSDAKEFEVSVAYSDKRGYQTTIPKPVMAKLLDGEMSGHLGESNKIKFLIKGSKIEIEKA